MTVNEEHKSLVINQDDTIEVFFKQSGTDTTANPFIWFYNLSKPAKAYFVKSDKILQILQVNNKSYKSPMVIAANAIFSDKILSFEHPKIVQIKVKATTNTTNVEIFGRI